MFRLIGKCAAQKKTFAVLVYGHDYIIMVILRSQRIIITDFFDDFSLIVSL